MLGLTQIRTRLNSATKTIIESPALLIFDNCPRLIEHLSALVTSEKNPEDVDTSSQPDHDYDVLRYIVLHKSQEITTSKVEGT